MSDPLVLVVEEEPMVREELARYLERDGFRVDAVEDFEQAIAAFSTPRPDLVLLDLMLPRVDGFEVFRRLRFPACSERSASKGTALSGLTASAKVSPAIAPEPRSGWPSRRQAKEVRRMRSDGCPDRTLVTLAPVVPANVASPQARCPGQELSELPPELGADLGAEISEFAHADRENCSEE